MTEDIIERAKAIVERFQNGYESPSINPIILDLIAEIEHLREHTDWQHENALKWKEACDELEDEKNQWKGRYLELKEDREQEMSDEDKKEIIDLDAELTAKDIEIERLRFRLEESQIKYSVDIASTDLHWQDEIAAKDAEIERLRSMSKESREIQEAEIKRQLEEIVSYKNMLRRLGDFLTESGNLIEDPLVIQSAMSAIETKDAEIKRLRAREEYFAKTIPEISDRMKQHVMITHDITSKVIDEAEAWIDRYEELEAEFLKLWARCEGIKCRNPDAVLIYSCKEERDQFMELAREELERIKEGGKDE